MSEIAKPLLRETKHSDPAALNQLFETLYDDLRVLARARLRRSNMETSLNTTGLVHESYLRFLKAGGVTAEKRHHFLAYASRVMRSIVVDLVRRRMAEKYGGEMHLVTLNTEIAESAPSQEQHVIRIHDALTELAVIDPRLVQVVEMRYFGGLTEVEVADALGITPRTVARDWEKAKLYLARALK
jgi:RNA polymerase sigma factor (TIGR02999 family)